MVAMAVRDVDVRKFAAWGDALDPDYKLLGLLDRDRRVDEDSFIGRVDQSG